MLHDVGVTTQSTSSLGILASRPPRHIPNTPTPAPTNTSTVVTPSTAAATSTTTPAATSTQTATATSSAATATPPPQCTPSICPPTSPLTSPISPHTTLSPSSFSLNYESSPHQSCTPQLPLTYVRRSRTLSSTISQLSPITDVNESAFGSSEHHSKKQRGSYVLDS
ncbi:endochitinase A-like [Chenopodium quinoa]|uniref:endochitinase A-like n=1 Tax=Chenopodium quinoa TaxID=63459 RepID=UPI000B797611|nr:endochitinase A-like [Chenopodium quinoa]